MLPEGGGDPVDGGFQSRPQSKAQGFIRRVAQTARGLQRLTGGVRELKVTVHSLGHKRSPLQRSFISIISYYKLITSLCVCAYLLQRQHAAEDAG